MAKAIIRRLETLNLQLWREAIRFEKMHDLVDDLEIKCEDLEFKDDERFAERTAAKLKACTALRSLSWELAELDAKAQELAYAIDAIVDDLGDTT